MAHPKEFAEGLSIGIIMDGNGRWAKNRGLPRTAGHKKGAAVFKDIAHYCDKIYNTHWLSPPFQWIPVRVSM